ncbi:MAG: C25 family cysteine peptidase, partial [Candidatus Eisenbacteria bacterium]|nr:C25 family cysteine peptidase [Candidatus Eisenbacteria bacterium]
GALGFYAVLPDTARILVVPPSSWMGASDLAATPSPVVPRPPLADGSRTGQFTLIYGSDELEAADGFRDLHLQRGDASSAEIVHTDDVWDEFSYGVLDPRALRWFLQWAFAHWAAPPEFVLLLGDGTWDYNRYLGQGASSNVVPSYGNPASDNFYASLNDTVFYPDIYVGRIPSQDGTQAAMALAKAQAYLDARSYDIWRKRSLFVTGGATAGDFSLYGTWVNVLYNVLIAPPPFIGTKITVAKNVENYWPGFYNSSIRAAIDSGCVVVNFFGHGATGTWDYMLESEDAALLVNGTRLPFIVSPTCFTGDFADPRDTVFAEHFLRLEGAQHGAIGFFGSSGTSYLAEGFEYAWALFSSLLRQGDPRMGPAVNAAKFSSFPWPTSTDSIMASVYNLLGDPLLPLAFPRAPDLHLDASGLVFSPAQPAASDSVTLVATVLNEGVAWASPVAATLRRDGVTLASATFTPDSLQNRIRFRWRAGDSPGTELLHLTLDSESTVPDPDAGDNALTFQIVLLRQRPLLLMPAADAMLARPQVECIASPAAEEPHTFQIATSDAFGSTAIDSAAGVSPVGGLVAWAWQAPSAGAFCWRARVDGGAWSVPRWFTVAPSDSGWAQSDPAQLAALAFSGCETSAQGLRLIETVSGRDYALLTEGALVDTVSSYNAGACGPENLIGGTTVNTDWGGAFYFLREDQDQWALVDLGRERMIKRLASAHEGQALTKRSVWSYFGIESSADGIEFVDWGHTPDYTDSGYGPWISSYITYDTPNPIPVRYIRFRYGKCYPFGPVYEGSRVYEVYAFSAAYPDSGWALSLPIGPAASWASLASTGVTPPGTDGVVQVLLPGPGDSWETASETDLGLTGSLTWLNAATHPVIRLRALLSSVPRDVTPRLTSWQVAYATIPDLRIDPDTVQINPPIPEPGSNARVHARIVNAGSAAVSAARYQLTVSENGGEAGLLQDAFAPWLAPGASESVHVAWQAVPGVSLFELTVDPLNAVPEADEDNNRAAGSARVLGNLAWIDSVALSPAAPAPGETLTVFATAANNGVLSVGQTMASCRWLAGGDSSAVVVPPMEPGQSADLQWRIAVPHTGATSLALTLDPDSMVQEVTRDDNVRLVPVTVTELADPAILSVGTECATPPIGDPFAMTVELVNAGGRPTGDMVLACTQVGGWTEHATVPDMAVGESTSVAVLWPTGDLPGTLSFLFVLDPDSLVTDRNRLNNTAGMEVTTARAPDLALQSTAVEPPVPVAGRAVTLTTTIRNRGIEGSPGFVVRLRNETMREQTVPDLGGQRTADLHWSLTPGVPGDMVLTLELDALGTVAEACEGNNTAAISVPVGIPWDLMITEEDLQRVDPGAPFVAWDSLELAITVHNAGDEEAPSALVGVYDGLAGASGILVSSAHTASLRSPGAGDRAAVGRIPGGRLPLLCRHPRGEGLGHGQRDCVPHAPA